MNPEGYREAISALKSGDIETWNEWRKSHADTTITIDTSFIDKDFTESGNDFTTIDFTNVVMNGRISNSLMVADFTGSQINGSIRNSMFICTDFEQATFNSEHISNNEYIRATFDVSPQGAESSIDKLNQDIADDLIPEEIENGCNCSSIGSKTEVLAEAVKKSEEIDDVVRDKERQRNKPEFVKGLERMADNMSKFRNEDPKLFNVDIGLSGLDFSDSVPWEWGWSMPLVVSDRFSVAFNNDIEKFGAGNSMYTSLSGKYRVISDRSLAVHGNYGRMNSEALTNLPLGIENPYTNDIPTYNNTDTTPALEIGTSFVVNNFLSLEASHRFPLNREGSRYDLDPQKFGDGAYYIINPASVSSLKLSVDLAEDIQPHRGLFGKVKTWDINPGLFVEASILHGLENTTVVPENDINETRNATQFGLTVGLKVDVSVSRN